jgi:hypothetical protein
MSSCRDLVYYSIRSVDRHAHSLGANSECAEVPGPGSFLARL